MVMNRSEGTGRIRAVAKEARAEAEAAKRGVARVAAQEEA